MMALHRERHDDEEAMAADTVCRVICGYVQTEADDMTVRQMAILLEVSKKPMEITPLSELLRIPLPSISQNLDKLVKLGYARRNRDGRKVTATVTPAGSAKIGRIMANVLM